MTSPTQQRRCNPVGSGTERGIISQQEIHPRKISQLSMREREAYRTRNRSTCDEKSDERTIGKTATAVLSRTLLHPRLRVQPSRNGRVGSRAQRFGGPARTRDTLLRPNFGRTDAHGNADLSDGLPVRVRVRAEARAEPDRSSARRPATCFPESA